MLKVLICERWSVGATGLPNTGSVTSVFRLSNAFGVWNQERVNPRFTWTESTFES